MRICIKESCENEVPKYFTDDTGKRHNCQRRKYCFKCSPYGEHNTKNLNYKKNSICKTCGKASQKGKLKCYNCYFSEAKKRKIKKVYNLIGYNCWKCNYNKGVKGTSILEFHHINPKTKLFQLSTRELVGYAWDRVFKEMQKCASLCCRCHREYHAGLISNEEIVDIYEKKWGKILSH
jgi:hypothetical protein